MEAIWSSSFWVQEVLRVCQHWEKHRARSREEVEAEIVGFLTLQSCQLLTGFAVNSEVQIISGVFGFLTLFMCPSQNDVSEKEQRWGAKTVKGSGHQEHIK